jgi:hypothetical protein
MAMNQARKGSIEILPKALFFATITYAFVVAARSSSVMSTHASNVVSYPNRDTKVKVDALIDPRSVHTIGQGIPNGKVMILGLIEWINQRRKNQVLDILTKQDKGS